MASFPAHENPNGQRSGTRGVASIPGTLNQLFRLASLAETRGAVLLRPGVTGWRPLSDARLWRRVVRLALYLSDIFGIGPGDRVGIASELRQEWLLADLAIMSLGAVSVAIEPRLPAQALQQALRDTLPRLLFASAAGIGKLPLVRGHVPPVVPVVGFDGPRNWGGPVPLAAALEVAGVLDTPKRSGAIRTTAWEVDPNAAACCHYDGYLDGHRECVELSQGEAYQRIMRYWMRPLARAGDRVYFAGREVTLRTRLALYAALGDGHSTVIIGTPGRELEEIAVLRPEKIVAPPALLEEAASRSRCPARPRTGEFGCWVGATLRRAVVGRARADQMELRAALGGKARWVAPTVALDPALLARLRSIVAIGPSSPNGAGGDAPVG